MPAVFKFKRNPLYAKRGMVATTQPLASQAGLEVLSRGGNAIDAAIATAAALTVVEPTSNGLGGDAFALVWFNGKLHGLNASGPAPLLASIEELHSRGFTTMPNHGWEPVTVPGIPAAWAELSAKFGRLTLKEVLQAAIRYAKEGFPLSLTIAGEWSRIFQHYTKVLKGELFAPLFETFSPVPKAGQIWSSVEHARTLESIGESNAEEFYRGEIASKIDTFSKKQGGLLRKEDLERFRCEWVSPIGTSYRGYEVWEIPPNTQGLSALMALNILEGLPLMDHDSEECYHHSIEAIKLAMVDSQHYVSDINYMQGTLGALLSKEYGTERRSLIKEHAQEPLPGKIQKGGTVYLATADSEGNMVSFIQSNYEDFGSGIVIPGTGIALQNRGHNFSLDPHHVNALAPGKKTFHTIIPGFLTKGGIPIGPFGVMGGFNQPQGHVQVLRNTIERLMDPQAALDAPRWRYLQGKQVIVEEDFPIEIVESLLKRGHEIRVSSQKSLFGRGQIIWRNPLSGVLVGGSESRADGIVATM